VAVDDALGVGETDDRIESSGDVGARVGYKRVALADAVRSPRMGRR
jgi:hypothetical protein